MQRISLHDAQPGMTLMEDVTNAQQMLLLKKGAILTADNIKILKSWGVSRLKVEAPVAPDEDPALNSAASPFASIAEVTALKFAEVDDDPIMVEIRRVAVEIIAARLTNPL
jgi:hypothetical protein